MKVGKYSKKLVIGQVRLHFHDKNEFTYRPYSHITIMVLQNMNKYIFVCLCLVYLGTETLAIDSKLINNGDEKISGSVNTPTESSIQEENKKLETNLNPEDYTSEKDGMLSRKKRWIALGFCINFPMCCDIKGKDQCAFFCPVCPIERDYCEYISREYLWIHSKHYSLCNCRQFSTLFATSFFHFSRPTDHNYNSKSDQSLTRTRTD